MLPCLALAHAAIAADLPPRQMEQLGRGLVAVPTADAKAFISWRLLGTDPDAIAFNLYRTTASAAPVKLNRQPITGATNVLVATTDLTKPIACFVRPILDGTEQPATPPCKPPAQSYLSIPLRTPTGYTPNDASDGDLDGDGEYEIVLHQASRDRDNSQARR